MTKHENYKRMIATGKRINGRVACTVSVDTDMKQMACPVCGRSFDYFPGFQPLTCHRGECRDKFRHGVDRDNWACNRPQTGEDHLAPDFEGE